MWKAWNYYSDNDDMSSLMSYDIRWHMGQSEDNIIAILPNETTTTEDFQCVTKVNNTSKKCDSWSHVWLDNFWGPTKPLQMT